ncbi:hypothetical protein [Erythrobacter alti]|uniref:hypothetical protein n=1 Tax=Erythrobacter alti TaxID=1896145 RepID=UPI0030F42B49
MSVLLIAIADAIACIRHFEVRRFYTSRMARGKAKRQDCAQMRRKGVNARLMRRESRFDLLNEFVPQEQQYRKRQLRDSHLVENFIWIA